MSFPPLVLRILETGELERPFRYGNDLAGPVEDFHDALADAMPGIAIRIAANSTVTTVVSYSQS